MCTIILQFQLVGAPFESSTVALSVAGSISVLAKYLYSLQLVVLGLAVCAHEFKYVCKFTFDSGVISNEE